MSFRKCTDTVYARSFSLDPLAVRLCDIDADIVAVTLAATQLLALRVAVELMLEWHDALAAARELELGVRV